MSYCTMNTNHNTEILIIGGGIAGCIAAISLSETYNVTLIDKLEEPVDKVGESLAPATQRVFYALGLSLNDDQYENLFLNNLGMQSYWGSDQLQILDHLRNPDGLSKSVDRKKLGLFLRKKALEKGVKGFWGFRLFSSDYSSGKWKVISKKDNPKNRTSIIIDTDFVIDATGRNSHFARSLGIKRTHFDSLISCWLTVPNTSKNTMSSIISDEFGWWYSAVLPENKRVISYQTDSDIFDKKVFKNFTSFSQLLHKNSTINKLVEHHTDEVDFHGVVSANSTKLNTSVGQQWLALGDAALSFDPLSSQGMFNAMANAMQVSELLKTYQLSDLSDSEKMNQFSKQYTSQIESVWAHYVKHKNLFYGAETRWNNSIFWKRRLENAFVL
ncbi:FAD_binding_3 domain-containing protein [Tenacibaculum sp. 190524A05c]|uniref:tryptophan 7-halogenase n=1 Tax=Tenacibaculum platacis TaxID=3137852 RepID=UPI0031FB32BA